MKKHLVIPIIASLSLIAVSTSLAVFSNSQINARTRADTYSIIMNANKNQLASDSAYFHYGTSTVSTELGNEIGFSFTNAAGVGAVKLQNDSKGYGGTLYNTTQITGMESISMTFSGSDSISCGFTFGGTADTLEFQQNFSVSSSTPLVFDFNGKKPNYFYFLNYSAVDLLVESIEITFSCNDAYPYLTLTSEDASKGTVSGGNAKFLAGSEVTVYANPKSGYKFSAWYAGDQLVSTSQNYTFVMPNYAYTLQARFITELEWKQERGVAPTVDVQNKKAVYGLYPQTRVKDNTLLSALSSLSNSAKDSNNGYFLYQNEYYTNVIATPDTSYGSSPYFKTGGTPEANTEYWFKCEPISWTLLKTEGNLYTLVSDEVLEVCPFYLSEDNRTISGQTIKPNNYQYSEARAFLNGLNGSSYGVTNYTSDNFMKRAFGLDSSYLQQIEVDNGPDTTGSSSNDNTCDNTMDKVYLGCCYDHSYYNAFHNSGIQPTDYSAARGAFMSTYSGGRYNTRYWLRSPESGTSNTKKVIAVDYNASNTSLNVTNAHTCLRPMITISL